MTFDGFKALLIFLRGRTLVKDIHMIMFCLLPVIVAQNMVRNSLIFLEIVVAFVGLIFRKRSVLDIQYKVPIQVARVSPELFLSTVKSNVKKICFFKVTKVSI